MLHLDRSSSSTISCIFDFDSIFRNLYHSHIHWLLLCISSNILSSRRYSPSRPIHDAPHQQCHSQSARSFSKPSTTIASQFYFPVLLVLRCHSSKSLFGRSFHAISTAPFSATRLSALRSSLAYSKISSSRPPESGNGRFPLLVLHQLNISHWYNHATVFLPSDLLVRLCSVLSFTHLA